MSLRLSGYETLSTSLRAKQSRARRKMDCFVASLLAMTEAFPSDHLALPELSDLVLVETEFGQHFLGLLAKFRRARRHLARRARQAYRLADQLDLAVLVVGHVLRDAEMLD